MAMQQCSNGHLYDDSKNSSCPYCSDGNTVNVTVPLSDASPAMGGNAFPQTTPLDGFAAQGFAPTAPIAPTTPGSDGFPATLPMEQEFDVTKYVDDTINENGIVEVRGWLVCLEGAKRGLDFKICGERNTIGRSSSNDIKLDFDSSISKGVNAIIAYDSRNNKFYISFGESKNNIYVNNQLLMTPIELKDYDIIEIGNTKMIFRSLCNETFNWTKDKKED